MNNWRCPLQSIQNEHMTQSDLSCYREEFICFCLQISDEDIINTLSQIKKGILPKKMD